MTVNLPNQWTTIDLPVLVHAAHLLDAEHAHEANVARLAQLLHTEVEEVQRSLLRLYDAGYVGGFRADSAARRGVVVTELTERGRREVGMWPSSSDGNALIEVLERAAAQAGDEETRGILQQMAKTGRNLSEGTAASVIGALVAKFTFGS